MSQELDIRVYLSPYKPIPSQVPGWPAGKQATWPASTSTLIAGPRSAVPVDALMTKDESVRLAGWVQASGKDLRAVYVTHPHAGHMFGIGAVLAAFPSARPVTLASMAPFMAEQASAGYRSGADAA